VKSIGIIGGMGPGATLDLFQKVVDLTPAKQDQDHIHLMIDNFPQIPDRTAFLMGEGKDPLPYLLEAAGRLEQSGVDALCMPCNTAHYFVEDIRSKTNIPFISIIESTIDKIKATHPGATKIGLMATRGTSDAGIYHKTLESAGLEVLPLSDSFKNEVMEVIYTVKAGRLVETVAQFNCCVQQLVDAGADVMIAGCTEIPLLLPHLNRSVAFVDPTLALAEKIVQFAQAQESDFSETLSQSN
jgi:aspartate racemase